MKILHIGLSSIMGGIESFALNYFKELSKQGVQFDFADIYGAGLVNAQEIRQLGGEIYTFPNFLRHPFKLKRQLTLFLKQHPYDAVHIHIQSAANLIPALCAKNAGIIPILHTHTRGTSGIVRKTLDVLNKNRLRKIPAVHLACGEEAGIWMWGKEDFTVVSNAIDFEKYAFDAQAGAAVRKQYGIAPEEIVLGFMGRLEPIKNPMFVPELVKSINCSGNVTGVKALVVGTGSLYEPMQEKVQKEHLEQQVILAGFRSNTSAHLSAMNIYLMPSISEGVSLAAIEAQANGLPCVFSAGVPQEIKITKNTVFENIEHIEDWVKAIESIILQGKNLRSESGSAIQAGDYDIKTAAKKLLEIYSNQKVEQP